MLIGPKRLLELAQEPSFADTELGDAKAIALDLRDLVLDDDEMQLVCQWLLRQPFPTIGLISKTAATQVTEALDLAVSSETEVETLLQQIQRNPYASAVLVQVTRATATLPTPTALAVESLGYATLQSGTEFAHWLAAYRQRKNSSKSTPANETQDPVLVQRNGPELQIQLNSPHNRNALSVAMRDGLTEAFKLVALDTSIERVAVSGIGPCFSAGGDLTEFGSAKDLALAHHIRQLRMPAQFLAPHKNRYAFTLHGACIGAGIELPAFAKHLRARPDTFFQLPEIAMGLIPGAGGCVSIPRRIGRQRTNYLAITGETLAVDRALSWGLIDEIVD